MLCSLLLVSSVHVRTPSLKIIVGMMLLSLLFWSLFRGWANGFPANLWRSEKDDQRSLENPNQVLLLIRKLLLLIFSISLFIPYFRYSALIKLKILQRSDLAAILDKIFSEHKDALWVDGVLSTLFVFIYLAFLAYLWRQEFSISMTFTPPEGMESEDLNILPEIAKEINKKYPQKKFELHQINTKGKISQAVFVIDSKNDESALLTKVQELYDELHRVKLEAMEHQRDFAEKMFYKFSDRPTFQISDNSVMQIGDKNTVQQQTILLEAIDEIKKIVEAEPDETFLLQNTTKSDTLSRLKRLQKNMETGAEEGLGKILLDSTLSFVGQLIPKTLPYIFKIFEHLTN